MAPSISQINRSVTRDGTITGVTVSATLSSSSTTVGNGEGSRYLNPLYVKPPRSASGPTNRSVMTNAKSPLTGPNVEVADYAKLPQLTTGMGNLTCHHHRQPPTVYWSSLQSHWE